LVTLYKPCSMTWQCKITWSLLKPGAVFWANGLGGAEKHFRTTK
jgi:hypothetical protein